MFHAHSLTQIALMTAILCILAPISIPIPISPVALTGSTFAIYFAACVLTPAQARISVLLYLLLGAVGVPVFSGYTAGFSRFTAPGGGYLVGYLFLVTISAFFCSRYHSRPILQIGGMFLATLVTYTIGTLWMAYVTDTSFLQSLPMGALVFLPFDFCKMLAACFLGNRIRPQLERMQTR